MVKIRALAGHAAIRMPVLQRRARNTAEINSVISKRPLCIMMICMRTTLNIQDGLYSDIKKLANESDMSISSIVHDLLLESLMRRQNRNH